MSEEVDNVVESFNLNENDISTITKNTIEAGFVDYNLRKKLIQQWCCYNICKTYDCLSYDF